MSDGYSECETSWLLLPVLEEEEEEEEEEKGEDEEEGRGGGDWRFTLDTTKKQYFLMT